MRLLMTAVTAMMEIITIIAGTFLAGIYFSAGQPFLGGAWAAITIAKMVGLAISVAIPERCGGSC